MSIIMPGQEEVEKYAGQSVVTPQQAKNQPFIKGPSVENVWNERHDIDATHEAVQQMLSGGTPNWVKWPEDYKAFAKEEFKSHQENSDRMAVGYRWADQDMLTNKQARCVNGLLTRDFVEKKLRANGVLCTVFDNGWIGPGGIPTVALWCCPPNNPKKLRAICYMDVPMMWEWSVLKLDPHGIPAGEASRGWRTVAVQLVEKAIITEKQCHQIFGVAPANAISTRYYQSLWDIRHRPPYQDEEARGLGE